MIERDYIDNMYEPSLAGLKRHLRITSSDQDALLETYLKAAIESAEHYIGEVIALSRLTQIEVIDNSAIVALRGPMVELKSVEVDGQPATSDSYNINDNSLAFGCESTGKRAKVVYLAGRKKVEYDITAAVYLTAADLFSNPVDSVRTLPTAASRLLDPHRNWKHGV